MIDSCMVVRGRLFICYLDCLFAIFLMLSLGSKIPNPCVKTSVSNV